MKKTRITAGIIVVLGIGIYLVAGSYSVLGIITAAFFAMLCMARRKKNRICSVFSRKRRKRAKH